MSYEITRWPGGAVERRHSQELDAVDRRTEVSEERVEGLGRVTKRAMYEAMTNNMLRKQAESVAPDGAEQYALLSVVGAQEMAQEIVRLGRRR